MNRSNVIKITIEYAAVLLMAAGTLTSYGDVVHLKSGGELTGIITSEKNGVLTIDLGFGSTSIDTAEVDSIEHSDKSDHIKIKKQWQIQYYRY